MAALFFFAIHAFAMATGNGAAFAANEVLARQLIGNAVAGLIKPSQVLRGLGFDWDKFLHSVSGPVRRWLEHQEQHSTPDETAEFLIDFPLKDQAGIPATVKPDHAFALTLEDAKQIIRGRCPGVVFASEWRPTVDGQEAGWSYAFLNAYDSQERLEADPEGRNPFADILYRGGGIPEAGARLKAAPAQPSDMGPTPK